MKQSESITKLAPALLAAQRELPTVKKNAENPFFSSHYADLTAVIEAVREPLNANGLAVVQLPTSEEGTIGLTTRLIHESGEWLEETIYVPSKDIGPQAAGSVITYLRRYALKAVIGLADEDDDAETAEKGRRAAQGSAAPAATERPSGNAPMLTCPDCGKQTVIRSKLEYGGGFVCYKKVGGCGHKFDGADPRFQSPPPSDNLGRKLLLEDIKREIEAASFTEPEIDYYRQQAKDAKDNDGLKKLLMEIQADAKRHETADLDAAGNKGFKGEIGNKLDALAGPKDEGLF